MWSVPHDLRHEIFMRVEGNREGGIGADNRKSDGQLEETAAVYSCSEITRYQVYAAFAGIRRQ